MFCGGVPLSEIIENSPLIAWLFQRPHRIMVPTMSDKQLLFEKMMDVKAKINKSISIQSEKIKLYENEMMNHRDRKNISEQKKAFLARQNAIRLRTMEENKLIQVEQKLDALDSLEANVDLIKLEQDFVSFVGVTTKNIPVEMVEKTKEEMNIQMTNVGVINEVMSKPYQTGLTNPEEDQAEWEEYLKNTQEKEEDESLESLLGDSRDASTSNQQRVELISTVERIQVLSTEQQEKRKREADKEMEELKVALYE